MTAVFTAFLSLPVFAQAVKRAAFDVTHYTMDVALSPGDRKMTATVDVIFVPQEDTRSVAFELNGSLKVDSITRVGSGPALPAGNLKTAPKGAPASRSRLSRTRRTAPIWGRMFASTSATP